MKRLKDLEEVLNQIDGKGYGAYRDIKGEYECKGYILCMDYVQVDPFASPSKVRIKVSESIHQIPEALWDTRIKKIAVSDFLTRAFSDAIRKVYNGVNGSGKSGLLSIDDCGAQMIERTSVIIHPKEIEVRFEVGLPAAGRKVLGRSAAQIFCKAIPEIVERSMLYSNLNQRALKEQVELIVDQEAIRCELRKRGLVSFIANGSILPRESGISQKPLLKGSIPFQSPKHLEVALTLPNRGEVKGLGIPKGITLIVGGGYHGKSTLLNAIELGVYNHIAGDGRELVITNEDAVKIRAEDGRSVEKVDISPFINNLPNGKDTIQFTTQNASGSTSQAANMMEALEVGTSCLLIDEDTSATNFMIRDTRMQKLVKKEKEPITPFIDRASMLYQNQGVSTILVVGGSGEYFDIADLVIMMDEYVPVDVTERAKEIARSFELKRTFEEGTLPHINKRRLQKDSLPPLGGKLRIKVRNKACISYGKTDIHLDFVEQLIDSNQTNCIGVMLEYLVEELLSKQSDAVSLTVIVDKMYAKIEKEGLCTISPYIRHLGNLVLPRKYEFIAAINRFRDLKME